MYNSYTLDMLLSGGNNNKRKRGEKNPKHNKINPEMALFVQGS